jgi:hypothetical protein
MKRSEFYEKICRIPLNCGLLEYYEALFRVVEFYRDTQPDWELIVEVLHKAALVANDEKLPLEKTAASGENESDVRSLLRFLQGKIDYLKENGVPKNVYDGTNISYDDSVFNWDIGVILERGAAWMTEGNEEDLPFDEPANWGTIVELILIGTQYE